MWKKPVGVSKYHYYEGESQEAYCGAFFSLDGREKESLEPMVEEACDRCLGCFKSSDDIILPDPETL